MRIFYPKFSRAQVIGLISERVPALQDLLPLKLLVLFGSYARGNYTVASDIDLLVVYSGEKRDDAFAVTKKTLAVPGIEPHVYTEAEYSELRATIDRMVEGGIVLFPSGDKIV